MVKIKKSIVEKIKSLNASGTLAAEIRLAGVAAQLAELDDESTAMQVLAGLEEEAAAIEDPTHWIQQAVKTILEEWKAAEEEIDVDVEEDGDWGEDNDGAAPIAAKDGKEGKPGDWVCPACGDIQFARRQECRQCGCLKPSAATKWTCPSCGELQSAGKTVCRQCGATRSAPKIKAMTKVAPGNGNSKAEFREGDWMCPECGNHVFGSKKQCGQCGKSRVGSVVFTAKVVETAGAKVENVNRKPGDWTCPACGDLQFARNVVCRSCDHPKPAGGGAGKGGVKERKPGDWECPACGDLQFASRTSCRSCDQPRPACLGKDGGGKGKKGKPGDWTCPACGDLQFARNEECRSCGGPRPVDAEEGGKVARVQPSRPGDWICPACADLQFARNEVCRRCGEARPDEENEEEDGAAAPPKKKQRQVVA